MQNIRRLERNKKVLEESLNRVICPIANDLAKTLDEEILENSSLDELAATTTVNENMQLIDLVEAAKLYTNEKYPKGSDE